MDLNLSFPSASNNNNGPLPAHSNIVELNNMLQEATLDQDRLLILLHSKDNHGNSLCKTLSESDLYAVFKNALTCPNPPIIELLKRELPILVINLMKQAVIDSISDNNLVSFQLLIKLLEKNDFVDLIQNKDFFHQIVFFGNHDMIFSLGQLYPNIGPYVMTNVRVERWDESGDSSHLLGTPLCVAVRSNNETMINQLYQFSPEGFAKSIKQECRYINPLNLLIGASSEVKNAMEQIAEMDVAVKEALGEAMLMETASSTPIMRALEIGNKEDIECLYRLSPPAFFSALSEMAWSKAIKRGNPELFQWLHTLNPNEFERIVSTDYRLLYQATKSNNPQIIDALIPYIKASKKPMVKMQRPDSLIPFTFVDYLCNEHPPGTEKLLEIFKKFPWYDLTMISRSEAHVAHAWHIQGSSQVIKKDHPEESYEVLLHGNHSSTWFLQFNEHWKAFSNVYADWMNEDDKVFFQEALATAIDLPKTYEATLERIAAGKPALIGGGYGSHAVTFLVWDDRFVVANRGGGGSMRRPIEIHHIKNPINASILSLLTSIDKDTYMENLTILEKELGLYQTSFDKRLEEAYELPRQTVGNCSWVSPTTAIYALMLLAEIDRDYQEFHIERQPEDPNVTLLIHKAISLYEKWLAFEQITALKQLVLPLEEKESVHYYPGHSIVQEAFRKANMIQLDEKMQSEIDILGKIYAQFLENPQRTEFLTDLVGFKTLHTISVTQLATYGSTIRPS